MAKKKVVKLTVSIMLMHPDTRLDVNKEDLIVTFGKKFGAYTVTETISHQFDKTAYYVYSHALNFEKLIYNDELTDDINIKLQHIKDEYNIHLITYMVEPILKYNFI